MVREHLSRSARRRAQPLLLVLLRAERRLVRPLRPPRGARRLHRPVREGTRGAAEHPLRHRGAGRDVRRRERSLARRAPRRRRRRGTRRRQRADQRGRHAEPAVDTGHRRARLVRGAGVPLLAVGSRRRTGRQAGRGGGHRCQRDAVRPRDRAAHRTPRDLSAVTPLGHAQPELPPPRDRRGEVALRARPLLRGVVPVPPVLEQRRPHLRRVPRRSRLARPGPLDQPGQRQAPPGRDRAPRARARRPARPDPRGPARLPGAGQADAPGQRVVPHPAA